MLILPLFIGLLPERPCAGRQATSNAPAFRKGWAVPTFHEPRPKAPLSPAYLSGLECWPWYKSCARLVGPLLQLRKACSQFAIVLILAWFSGLVFQRPRAYARPERCPARARVRAYCSAIRPRAWCVCSKFRPLWMPVCGANGFDGFGLAPTLFQ